MFFYLLLNIFHYYLVITYLNCNLKSYINHHRFNIFFEIIIF